MDKHLFIPWLYEVGSFLFLELLDQIEQAIVTAATVVKAAAPSTTMSAMATVLHEEVDSEESVSGSVPVVVSTFLADSVFCSVSIRV